MWLSTHCKEEKESRNKVRRASILAHHLMNARGNDGRERMGGKRYNKIICPGRHLRFPQNLMQNNDEETV